MNEYTMEYQREHYALNVYWEVEDRLVLLAPVDSLEHDTGGFLKDTAFMAHSIDSDSPETRDVALRRCALRWPHIHMTVVPKPGTEKPPTHNVSRGKGGPTA
jgi:hypothetical protein